jgi:hypothetical protein
MQNARRALLVGLNYPGSGYSLRGCDGDTALLKAMLTSPAVGFAAKDVRVVASGDAGSTRAGLLGDAFAWLLAGGRAPGDALFFGFSGHGTMLPDNSDDAIVAADGNLVSNVDLKRSLLSLVPPGVRLLSMLDCCHSGGLGALPIALTADGRSVAPRVAAAIQAGARRSNVARAMAPGAGDLAPARSPILLTFSACLTSQTAADGACSMKYVRQTDGSGTWVSTPMQGAFTAAFAPAAAAALASPARLGTPRNILGAVAQSFASGGLLQTPVLSTNLAAAADAPFAPWLGT